MQMPFFYGWIIVAIAMIAGFISSGVSNVTMAVVLKPISEDLGWSRSVMAAAITLGSFSGGVVSPVFCALGGRFWPRVFFPPRGGVGGVFFVGGRFGGGPWGFFAHFFSAPAPPRVFFFV